MREPKIRIGYIIINPYWREELERGKSHSKTASEWINKYNFQNIFNTLLEEKRVIDEEDFLMNYIGAVKLCAYRGKFYCYLPSVVNDDKEYIKNYYENLGYIIIEGKIFDEEKYKEKTIYNYPYNKTLIKVRNSYHYNPMRDGD